MKRLVLAAIGALALGGCAFDGGYGLGGVSVGYGSGYGYNNGYGYNGYGNADCIAYDRYGRAYYTCGNYYGYGSNRYTYNPRTVIYYYPGYTYRQGYYYDRNQRRYDSRYLYQHHYRNDRRRHDRRRHR